MKKILIALAVLVFGASALQQARADVSIDLFYDNLSGGNWIDVEGYGYGWQPDLAVNDQNWRPYADGYWAYTDDGWTWVSYEDFGWATYHYGRWANLSDYGWVWFPGEDLDWGPAWVSWRTGGDYVGWAPLPPRGPGVVYEGRPIGSQVDIEFDIGPEYYNFCEVRYIGEPVLRNYIAPRVQNVTYINNTVNVTNITVQNNVVYNYGPNYEVLSAHSNRPIQRLSIERQSAANLSAAAKSGALTKVQGNKLVVAAPPRLAKAPPTAKPPTVKTKVAQPKINRGWAGVQNEAELKQKIKAENPKNVPPPTAAAVRAPGGPSPAVGASPASPGGAAPPVSPGPRGKPARATPGAKPTPPGPPTGAPPSPVERGKGRFGGPGASPKPGVNPRQLMRQGQDEPASTPGRASAGATLPNMQGSPAEKERGKSGRGKSVPTPPLGQMGGATDKPTFGEKFKPAPTEQTGAASRALEHRGGQQRGQPGYSQPLMPPTGTGTGVGEARSAKERGQPAVHQSPPTGQGLGEARGAKERGQLNKPPTSPPPGAGPGEARGGRERGQGAYGQPGGQPRAGAPAPSERGQGQPERGKKKGEGTPPPRGPQ
jgi:hypothetical protein